jgi:hypothetical protein
MVESKGKSLTVPELVLVVVTVVRGVDVTVTEEMLELVAAVVCLLANSINEVAMAGDSALTADMAVRSSGKTPCLYFPAHLCRTSWREASETEDSRAAKEDCSDGSLCASLGPL